MTVLTIANSEEPDEMSHNAAFHLGLLCLPQYLFTGTQNRKEDINNKIAIVQGQLVHITEYQTYGYH